MRLESFFECVILGHVGNRSVKDSIIRSVIVAQDAWRDSKSPSRPRDVTTFRLGFISYLIHKILKKNSRFFRISFSISSRATCAFFVTIDTCALQQQYGLILRVLSTVVKLTIRPTIKSSA